MEHDFKQYPELTNRQMQEFYFDSPHKQITEDFEALVVKVIDGDTIRVTTDFRDFSFPIRLANIAAAEKNEGGGVESQRWLEGQIGGKRVTILVNDKNRVGKFGRLIGEVLSGGLNINEMSKMLGFSTDFGLRKSNVIPNFEESLNDFRI